MKITTFDAESIAIRVFSALAGDESRLSRFLNLTGLAPETIRAAAASPGFLAAVLDHVARDEELLLWVAGDLSTTAAQIMEAHVVLSPPACE